MCFYVFFLERLYQIIIKIFIIFGIACRIFFGDNNIINRCYTSSRWFSDEDFMCKLCCCIWFLLRIIKSNIKRLYAFCTCPDFNLKFVSITGNYNSFIIKGSDLIYVFNFCGVNFNIGFVGFSGIKCILVFIQFILSICRKTFIVFCQFPILCKSSGRNQTEE